MESTGQIPVLCLWGHLVVPMVGDLDDTKADQLEAETSVGSGDQHGRHSEPPAGCWRTIAPAASVVFSRRRLGPGARARRELDRSRVRPAPHPDTY